MESAATQEVVASSPWFGRCRDHVRGVSPHFLTTIAIEDEQAAQDKLTSNAASPEEEFGPTLQRVRATVWP